MKRRAVIRRTPQRDRNLRANVTQSTHPSAGAN
jgi:hypothetical protein